LDRDSRSPTPGRGVDDPQAADVARKANDEPSTAIFVIFFARLENSVVIPLSICALPPSLLQHRR